MQITEQLRNLRSGGGESVNAVIPLVYEELKKLARSHLRRGGAVGCLQTTALVHEAFLRLSAGRHPSYENRAHFYGVASRVMRQVLIDSARARSAIKRDAGMEVVQIDLPDPDTLPNRTLLALDDALQHLEEIDPVKARLVEMRYFCGMTANETSIALSMPVHTVRRELRLAQAWLRREMSGESARADPTRT